MKIQDKPIESLKIQINNFLKYAEQEEKYSKIIYELMGIDNENFEKYIQNVWKIKNYLASKWIQKELINNFEEDYYKYINSDKYYYWPIDNYPIVLKESIKENDEIMKKIKWIIISISKNEKSLFNINNFVEETINTNQKNTSEITDDDFNIYSNFIWIINEYHWLLIEYILKNIMEWIPTRTFIGRITEKIKNYINEIWNKINNITASINSKTIELIKEKINDSFNRENIKKILLNRYLSMYFEWTYQTSSIQLKNGYIPTIYTKNRFDTKIIKELTNENWGKNGLIDQLINQLWNNIDDEFLDDIFIHQSDFRVLEDIISEWWLISSDEIVKRSKTNKKIHQSKNSYPTADIDKDICFTRWFANYEYWHSEKLEDVIYFANTMRQFWKKWYWIPINANTQNSYFTEIWSTKDPFWYTIISKNVLEDKDSYSKVNLDDLYIFLHEEKKEQIDQIIKNLWSDNTNNIHIVYIPNDIYPKKDSWYKTNNTFKITEYIREYLNKKTRERIIPKGKTARDSIIKRTFYNMDQRNNIWVDCEYVGEKEHQKKCNRLKNIDNELLLKIYKKYFWKDAIIDQETLNKIENIDLPIEYPKELIKFSTMLISWNIYEWDENLKNFFIFLRKEWYSQKDVSILWFIHDFITLANWSREISEKEKYWWLWKFCNNWNINYNDMKAILINIWNIIDSEINVRKLIRAQEKGYYLWNNIY